jgi:hypothetical protein
MEFCYHRFLSSSEIPIHGSLCKREIG